MKLKHCPFCGENQISVGEILIHKNDNKLPSVWCENCGARVTAPKNSSEYAVKLWNSRAKGVDEGEMQMKNQTKQRYLSTREVADYFGVSTQTVRDWGAHGYVRIIRLAGGIIRVDKASVENFEKKAQKYI